MCSVCTITVSSNSSRSVCLSNKANRQRTRVHRFPLCFVCSTSHSIKHALTPASLHRLSPKWPAPPPPPLQFSSLLLYSYSFTVLFYFTTVSRLCLFSQLAPPSRSSVPRRQCLPGNVRLDAIHLHPLTSAMVGRSPSPGNAFRTENHTDRQTLYGNWLAN